MTGDPEGFFLDLKMTQHNETRGALIYELQWCRDNYGTNRTKTAIDQAIAILSAPSLTAGDGLTGERIREIAETYFHQDDTEIGDVVTAIKTALQEAAAPSLPAGDGLTDEQILRIASESVGVDVDRLGYEHIKFARAVLAAPRQPGEVENRVITALIEKIEGHEFSCIFGPLEKNIDWQKLRALVCCQLGEVGAGVQAIEAMVAMLENGEWAEHVAATTGKGDPLAQRLEDAITNLINEANDGRELAGSGDVDGAYRTGASSVGVAGVAASAQQNSEPRCDVCGCKTTDPWIDHRGCQQIASAQQDEREQDLLVKLDDAKRALHFWKTQYQTLANGQQVQAHARGEVVVTWDERHTRILAVTRQDEDGRILSIIAEAPTQVQADAGAVGDLDGESGIYEPTEGMTLDVGDLQFLATRLRRLFKHFNYPLPKFADKAEAMVGVAGSCIGGLLANLNHPSPVAESDKREQALTEDMRLDLAAISEAIAHGDHAKAQALIREILTIGFTANKNPDIAVADDIRMVLESVDYWVLNQQVYIDHRSDLDDALKRLRAAMSREQSGGGE